MFCYPFILFVNYLVFLHCVFVTTQINVNKNIMFAFLRVPNVIFLGLKISFDQNYTHSRNTTNMVIKRFNLDYIHIQTETPERTMQKAFIRSA